MPPKLAQALDRLGALASNSVYDMALELLGGSLSAVQSIRSNATDRLDVSDAAESDMATWLLSHHTSPGVEILAVWLADRVGAKMKAADFAGHVGDLWYPSMDDVLLLTDDHEFLRILVLDHEELFTYSRMEKQTLANRANRS